MALDACAARALDVSSQSLLLQGAQGWFHRAVLRQKRTSIACGIAHAVGNVPLATFGEESKKGGNFQKRACVDEGHYNASDEGHCDQYFAAHKASDGEHVVRCKEGEEGWGIFKVSPLLCMLLHIDALQAIRWVRFTAFFVFVSFVLGIRAASASQTHPTHVPVVARTCSLENLVVEGKVSAISSEVDAALDDSTKIVDNFIDADQEGGKALEAEANDNVLCTNSRRNSQDAQVQDYNHVAYHGYEDSMYKKGEDTFLEGERMQHICTSATELQMQTSANKSSGANMTTKERRENSVKNEFLEKRFQELSSAAYKLMVPLRVVGLRGSVPPIWLKDFRLSQGKRVKIRFESQGGLEDIVSALDSALKKRRVTPRCILAADVVTLGDTWLHAAVSGRLIQPIENAEQHEWFNRLGPKWQAFLRRDQDGHLDPEGLVWGAPYRWGSMVIAFRTDKLSKNNIPGIEDWKDLWKPELTGKIAMVDSSREVVGAVLKSLGASYNAQDFDKDVEGGREAVKQQLLALQNQVKVFDSIHYLKALQSDDVWVAVGWSSDVIPVAKRMSNIRVVAPKSGASLWADLWAIPAANSFSSNKIGSRVHGASPLVHQWFDFCLQPARSEPFMQGVFVGASPLLVFEEDHGVIGSKQKTVDAISGRLSEEAYLAGNRRMNGPEFDTNMIEGMPPEDSLEKSEMLKPLSEKALANYRWLFAEVSKQGNFGAGTLKRVQLFFQGSIKQK